MVGDSTAIRLRGSRRRQATAAKIDNGAGSITKPGIHQRAAHFECAARRVSDEVGVRLGKERGENDAARKHDGNAIVHVARHASFQSPPGGGSLTSIPRPDRKSTRLNSSH